MSRVSKRTRIASPEDPVVAVPSGPSTASLQASLNTLPIELLLEIAIQLGDAEDDEPRSRSAETFLHVLMTSSHAFRAIARPKYWREVHMSTKVQWEKLRGLLKGNRFKRTPAVITADMIHTLHLELKNPAEGFGGLDETCLQQMAETLNQVSRLRIRMNEQTRLTKRFATSGKSYIDYLSLFAVPAPSFVSSLSHLSICNTVPEPFLHTMALVLKLPNLRSLLVDNVSASIAHDGSTLEQMQIKLPNLRSFTLRNSPDIVFDAASGFTFLLETEELNSLTLRDARIDSGFLKEILELHSESMTNLEIGTAEPPGCLSRECLEMYAAIGRFSLDTGFYLPIDVLNEPRRMGNEALKLCPELVSATLGGVLCTSPALFDILLKPDREPLHELRLFNAWPMRPLRPTHDMNASAERLAIEQNPSGIAPADVLAALEKGWRVAKLELKGMGHEWDMGREEAARNVKQECERLGISLVCR